MLCVLAQQTSGGARGCNPLVQMLIYLYGLFTLMAKVIGITEKTTIKANLPNSSNPFGMVGGFSGSVSNGNAGISYLNNNDGSAYGSYGGRLVPEPCCSNRVTKSDLICNFLAPWQKIKTQKSALVPKGKNLRNGLKMEMTTW